MGSFSLTAIASPRSHFFFEAHLLALPNACCLRQLAFKFLVPFPKVGEFPQAILDSATEAFLFGLSRPQRIFVLLPDLGSPLREFRLEARPCALVLAVVLVLEQPEGFFGGQLGDAGEILNAEAIQNLGAAEFALPTAQAGTRLFRSAM